MIKKFIEKKIYMRDEKYAIVKKSKFFNEKWYKETYNITIDPCYHYCNEGYKKGFDPSPEFSHIKYELIYDDVRYVKANPLWHFEKYGCTEPYFLEEPYISPEDIKKTKKCIAIQNKEIQKEYNKSIKNLIVFLVPELNIINGGVMSICSIAKVSKKCKETHNSEVIIATMPSNRTFFKYSKFKCEFNIYRFDLITKYFKNLENVIIHIPENYVHPFLYFLTPEQQLWMKKIDNLQINILNQNAELLPRPRLVNYLKDMAKEVTMTCAHKQYCIEQYRTSYDISVHWLSTSNFIKYKYKSYNKKKNLLLYSPDNHPMKEKILNKIKQNFPNIEFKEIKNMKYEDYLNTISNAKWMITFGEGLDGYFTESLRSGTLSFAAYNETFFNDEFSGLNNVFKSYKDMYTNIVDIMKKYENEQKYTNLVNKCIAIDKKAYDDNQYVLNIQKFYKKDYTYPIAPIIEKRKKLLERKPLISIAVATYNGEKYIEEQIDSLLNLDYPNYEIVVSDDNSTDNTYKILKKYSNKIKLFKNHCQGINNNFTNAINNCKGEYIALCDQDDIWEKNKLKVLLEHIDNFDIIHSGVSIINENSEYHRNSAIHKAYEIDKTNYHNFSDFITENHLLGCTSLIKKTFLNKFYKIPSESIYHDWWYVLMATKNGNGLAYIDEELTRYRQHGENTAYMTYNSPEWCIKKIYFDKYLLNNIKSLNFSEQLKIEKDMNINIIKYLMQEALPNFDFNILLSGENIDKDTLYNLHERFTYLNKIMDNNNEIK